MSAVFAIFAAPPWASAEAASLFLLGPQQVGLSLGYGHGVKFADSGLIEGHEVREFIVRPHWQIEVTRRPEDPPWYGGSLAFRAEGTVLVNFSPRTGVAGGFGLLFRYNFLRWEPLAPYLQGGAGLIGLDFDLADQDDGLAFAPEAGVGLCYRLGPRLSVDAGMRFHHISNANTDLPNGGVDTLQFMLGLAYHFD